MRQKTILQSVALWCGFVLCFGCAHDQFQNETKQLKERVAQLERKLGAQQALLEQLSEDRAGQQERATQVNENIRRGRGPRENVCEPHELMLKQDYDKLVAGLTNTYTSQQLTVRKECVVTKGQLAIVEARKHVAKGFRDGFTEHDRSLFELYLESDGRDEAWASSIEKAFGEALKQASASNEPMFAHMRGHLKKNLAQYAVQCGRTVCLFTGPQHPHPLELMHSSNVSRVAEDLGSGTGFVGIDGSAIHLMYRRHLKPLKHNELEDAVREYLVRSR